MFLNRDALRVADGNRISVHWTCTSKYSRRCTAPMAVTIRSNFKKHSSVGISWDLMSFWACDTLYINFFYQVWRYCIDTRISSMVHFSFVMLRDLDLTFDPLLHDIASSTCQWETFTPNVSFLRLTVNSWSACRNGTDGRTDGQTD